MNLSFNIPYGGDHYEIVVIGNRITRVTKYCGDSQYTREMEFEDVHEEVKKLLIEKLNERYT